MIPRPPRPTRTNKLFPNTTLHVSSDHDRVIWLSEEATIQIEGYNLDQLILRRSGTRSEEHTSVQSLMRISYAVFCLKKKKTKKQMTCNRINKKRRNR